MPMFSNSKENIINNYFRVFGELSQTTDDFLFLLDINERNIYFFGNVSDKYAICEYGERKCTFSDLLKIIHPSDRGVMENELKEMALGLKIVIDANYRWYSLKGNYVWVNARGRVVKDENGNPVVMVGRVSEEALMHLCNPLTGLFNQQKLLSDLNNNSIGSANKYLMLVDIDDLSAINLTHGRKYGDMLLKTLAQKIDDGVNKNIYHAERNFFAVCLDYDTEQKVVEYFHDLQSYMGDRCTVSAGVVPIDVELFKDASGIFDSAKLVLRKAKQKGRGVIEFFTDEEIKRKIASLELLEELNESVNNNFRGFELYYQPQVKSGNYSLYSAEALLRYTSKNGKRVFPDEFIPILEQSKLIIPVGMWVLETALNQCKEWRKVITDMRVNVNFSLVQFEDKSIVENVISVIKKVGVPPQCLTAEITESVNLNESKYFISLIKKLKDFGIQIAIDDFGTGYSNIGYLKQLTIDEIKIDRMFVKDIEEGTYNFKIVSNTLDFAKMNSISVCCEGVETTHELAVLESRSPDLIQGYLFNMPCSADEFNEIYINTDSEKFRNMEGFISELYEYRAKTGVISFNPKEILSQTNVGLWVIRKDLNSKHSELHIDDTMERIMGIENKLTSTECYEYWYNRICRDYRDYVDNNFKNMTDTDKVIQLQYSWNHPQLGKVIVRSNFKRSDDSNGMLVYEGYHRILSNIEEV